MSYLTVKCTVCRGSLLNHADAATLCLRAQANDEKADCPGCSKCRNCVDGKVVSAAPARPPPPRPAHPPGGTPTSPLATSRAAGGGASSSTSDSFPSPSIAAGPEDVDSSQAPRSASHESLSSSAKVGRKKKSESTSIAQSFHDGTAPGSGRGHGTLGMIGSALTSRARKTRSLVVEDPVRVGPGLIAVGIPADKVPPALHPIRGDDDDGEAVAVTGVVVSAMGGGDGGGGGRASAIRDSTGSGRRESRVGIILQQMNRIEPSLPPKHHMQSMELLTSSGVAQKNRARFEATEELSRPELIAPPTITLKGPALAQFEEEPTSRVGRLSKRISRSFDMLSSSSASPPQPASPDPARKTSTPSIAPSSSVQPSTVVPLIGRPKSELFHLSPFKSKKTAVAPIVDAAAVDPGADRASSPSLTATPIPSQITSVGVRKGKRAPSATPSLSSSTSAFTGGVGGDSDSERGELKKKAETEKPLPACQFPAEISLETIFSSKKADAANACDQMIWAAKCYERCRDDQAWHPVVDEPSPTSAAPSEGGMGLGPGGYMVPAVDSTVARAIIGWFRIVTEIKTTMMTMTATGIGSVIFFQIESLIYGPGNAAGEEIITAGVPDQLMDALIFPLGQSTSPFSTLERAQPPSPHFHLHPPPSTDMTYATTLLATYRFFLPAPLLLSYLIEWYNVDTDPTTTTPSQEQWFRRHRKHIASRAVRVLLLWVRNHWHDFEASQELSGELKEFMDHLGSMSFGDSQKMTQAVREQ
ncbi:hypothetical protein BDK51DRAFT_37015, partial [Blyttiomyces helicus]